MPSSLVEEAISEEAKQQQQQNIPILPGGGPGINKKCD